MTAALLGTGNIAPAYVEGCSRFSEDIRLVACADLVEARAQAFAAKFGLSVLSVEELLRSDEL